MSENEIAGIVVDTCYHIHVEIGPGLLESVYEEILFYELVRKGWIKCRKTKINSGILGK